MLLQLVLLVPAAVDWGPHCRHCADHVALRQFSVNIHSQGLCTRCSSQKRLFCLANWRQILAGVVSQALHHVCLSGILGV